ncbi:MAG: cupin domain-containing protein [Phycisphaerales bacterium]|nr:MAG: cupin domain-containing protein [Phycisphaerales bacterium]
MVIRKAADVESTPVHMKGVKDVTMRILVGRCDGAPNFSLRQFTVEPGGHTPRHRHNYEHENYILSGTGQVFYEDAFHDITGGDVLFVEANQEHQFLNTGSEPLEFLCLVPVSFEAGGGQMEPTPGS